MSDVTQTLIETRGWKELYNERTSVERCNSRLKEHLTMNDVHLRGIRKVTAHAYLNAIVLLVSVMAVNVASRAMSA